MKTKHWYIILVASLFITGCKKEEVTVYEDLVISGNNPPPYIGITTLQVENYVNKLYIDLLGEQPSETELNQQVQSLKDDTLNINTRKQIILNLANENRYYSRRFQQISVKFLEGTSKDEIQDEILTYTYVRDLFLMDGDTQTAQIVAYELEKLNKLYTADTDYQNGTITINEFYKIVIFNIIYDNINMGSENFVISCFENLFSRYPSQQEQSNGIDMVDGISSQILLTDGNSKLDFVNIITDDGEFYAGRVIEAYQQFLLREPNSQETSTLANQFASDNNLENMFAEILSTDEYAGFE